MMRDKRFLWIASLALLLLTALAWQAVAQKPGETGAKKKIVITEHPQKSRGAASDSNVKQRSFLNDAALKTGGDEKTRDLLCGVEVENHTGWRVQVFIDGTLEGVVGPKGELYTVTVCGRTKVYAVAEFEDSSTFTWGPKEFSTSEGDYTWALEKN